MTLTPIEITRTVKDTGERLSQIAPAAFGSEPGYEVPSVMVDDTHRFQRIEGFGGAFTEASAATFSKMDSDAQSLILRAYFDPVDGIGYNLCRTHINSCDFALGNYAYDETDGDVELKNFSIERDRRSLIPFIRAAMQVAGQPIKLRLVSENVRSCSRAFVIPSLGVQEILPQTGEVVIEIPAQEAGTEMPFMCSMAMFTGTIVFDL